MAIELYACPTYYTTLRELALVPFHEAGASCSRLGQALRLGGHEGRARTADLSAGRWRGRGRDSGRGRRSGRNLDACRCPDRGVVPCCALGACRSSITRAAHWPELAGRTDRAIAYSRPAARGVLPRRARDARCCLGARGVLPCCARDARYCSGARGVVSCCARVAPRRPAARGILSRVTLAARCPLGCSRRVLAGGAQVAYRNRR